MSEKTISLPTIEKAEIPGDTCEKKRPDECPAF